MLFRTQAFTYDLTKKQSVWRELIGETGIYQGPTLAVALKQVGKRLLAIDVGAHFGMNSMAYSELFENVVSFEPQPALYRQALKHFRMNHVSNVKLHRVALGNRKSKMKIFIPTGANDGQARLVSSRSKLPTVEVRRLDSYRFEPDFLKIDVEGFEANVLLGASDTLKRHRPVVLVETNDNVEWEAERKRGPERVASRYGDEDVFAQLRALDYRAFIPRPQLIEMRNEREFRCRDFDSLFIPRERKPTLPVRLLTSNEIRIGMAPPLKR